MSELLGRFSATERSTDIPRLRNCRKPPSGIQSDSRCSTGDSATPLSATAQHDDDAAIANKQSRHQGVQANRQSQRRFPPTPSHSGNIVSLRQASLAIHGQSSAEADRDSQAPPTRPPRDPRRQTPPSNMATKSAIRSTAPTTKVTRRRLRTIDFRKRPIRRSG